MPDQQSPLFKAFAGNLKQQFPTEAPQPQQPMPMPAQAPSQSATSPLFNMMVNKITHPEQGEGNALNAAIRKYMDEGMDMQSAQQMAETELSQRPRR